MKLEIPKAIQETIGKLQVRFLPLQQFSVTTIFSAFIGLLCLLILLLIVFSIPRGSPLPDMTAFEAGAARKSAFIDFLTPIVESRNQEIQRDRERLLKLSVKLESGKNLSLTERSLVNALADEYALQDPDSLTAKDKVRQLLLRVDQVPLVLVLVQAAKESGWGTSRFARQGNNLFGQWCYTKGCGLVPSNRSQGAKHEVRVFDSVEAAISAYLHNLNTGRAYRKLRDIRAALHQSRKRPDAISLADGLLFYSQRRQAYVDEVKLMIHQLRKFQKSREK
ncbi:MAG: glucosaminidase domain-containing protein [Pseudomonadota bacterium]